MNILIGVYIFIVGSVFASFFGLLIDRLPKNLNVVSLKSRCDNCGHELKWYENIPILSYIFLSGKCSKCKTKIPAFLFILEIIGGASILFIYLKYGLTIECLIICLITLMLVFIGGYDYKTNYVLNVSLYILAALSLGLFAYRVFVLDKYLLNYVYSALMGFIFLFLIKVIMSKVLKREALGNGDIFLITIMGLCFSPLEHMVALFLSSFIGSVVSIILIKVNKTDRHEEIAFCPYLCFGYYLMFIFGNIITKLLVG